MKARSSFHLIAAQGFAVPLNPGAGTCIDDSTHQPVVCRTGAVPVGQRPDVVPFALMVMLGWSL